MFILGGTGRIGRRCAALLARHDIVSGIVIGARDFGRAKHVPSEFGMFAAATGRRAKREVRFSCWPSGPWESTVGPLTVAALRILRGEVEGRGVLPPEACFEPMSFLREAAAYGPMPLGDAPILNESEEVVDGSER